AVFQLQWEWTRAKQQVAPWWAENSKEAYKSGLDGLARALQNWTDSRAGRRKGARSGSHTRRGRAALGRLGDAKRPWSRPEDPACWAGGHEAGSWHRAALG